MTEENEASAMQRDWEVIFQDVRKEVKKLIPLIASMKPEELKTFIDTLQAMQWGEYQTATLDKRIDLELSRTGLD